MKNTIIIKERNTFNYLLINYILNKEDLGTVILHFSNEVSSDFDGHFNSYLKMWHWSTPSNLGELDIIKLKKEKFLLSKDLEGLYKDMDIKFLHNFSKIITKNFYNKIINNHEINK